LEHEILWSRDGFGNNFAVPPLNSAVIQTIATLRIADSAPQKYVVPEAPALSGPCLQRSIV